jgi:hypothetical protein
MRFLEAVSGAVVDRPIDELIGALLVATVVAIVMTGLYALGRRRVSNPPVLVGGLVLASGVLCMTLTAGYIEYRAPNLSTTGWAPVQPPRPGWPPNNGPDRNSTPGPRGSSASRWLHGFHFVAAADEDRDGRVTLEEVTALLRRADLDGEGSVDFADIDRAVVNHFFANFTPTGAPSAAPGASRQDSRRKHHAGRDGSSASTPQAKNEDRSARANVKNAPVAADRGEFLD